MTNLTPEQLEKCREAFEVWGRQRDNYGPHWVVKRHGHGYYAVNVNADWLCFQAAWQAAQSQVDEYVDSMVEMVLVSEAIGGYEATSGKNPLIKSAEAVDFDTEYTKQLIDALEQFIGRNDQDNAMPVLIELKAHLSKAPLPTPPAQSKEAV